MARVFHKALPNERRSLKYLSLWKTSITAPLYVNHEGTDNVGSYTRAIKLPERMLAW